VVMAADRQVRYEDLPGSVRRAMAPSRPAATSWQPGQTLDEMVGNLEKNVLTQALKHARTQARAARLLGINQSTIARKLKKYGLTRSGAAPEEPGLSE